MKRAWCRLRHRGRYLTASQQGRGTLRCTKCGAGFVDLADAGRVHLEPEERTLSTRAQLHLERAGTDENVWEAGAYRLVRGGRLVGDPDDAGRKRVAGGETVKVARVLGGRW
jgi:hypothetical protein